MDDSLSFWIDSLSFDGFCFIAASWLISMVLFIYGADPLVPPAQGRVKGGGMGVEAFVRTRRCTNVLDCFVCVCVFVCARYVHDN